MIHTMALFIEYRNWVWEIEFAIRLYRGLSGVFVADTFAQPQTKYNILMVDFSF